MLPQRAKQFKICIVTAALDSEDYALRVNAVYDPSLRGSVGRERTPSSTYAPVAGKPVFSNLVIHELSRSATPMINSGGLFKIARGCSTVWISNWPRDIPSYLCKLKNAVPNSTTHLHVPFACPPWLELLFHAGATVASGQHIINDNVSLLCGQCS